DTHVVGRRLTIGAVALEVVGVMPRGFSGHSVERVDLWLPLPTIMQGLPGWDKATNLMTVGMTARLPPGMSVAAAAGRMSAATRMRVMLSPLIGAHVDPEPNRIALWLAGVSLAVLLAGLANGATLSLVRSTRRRRDTSIRV